MSTDTIKKVKKITIDRTTAITPEVDIYVSDNEALLYIDLPGVAKGDISLEIDKNNHLIIQAVNSYKEDKKLTFTQFTPYNYFRSFKLDNDYDVDNINGELNNGQLKIVLPKRAEVKPKNITIN